jgi:hypothetical protein
MLVFVGQRFKYVQEKCLGLLIDVAPSVGVGEWQSQDVRDRPEMVTRELMNVSLETQIDEEMRAWQEHTGCNLPWAEDHFQERVSGIPHNPPPSEAYWPFAVKGNEEHKDGELFSHTYPERFWPKQAGGERAFVGVDKPVIPFNLHYGIRYPYGDLADVVKQLENSPLTRQAYLPVWFPEDTGAVQKQRVPCTLGYHFLVRENAVHVTYFIRSCDALRHWPDDVYMGGRLAQWVCDQLNTSYDADEHLGFLVPGKLIMHIGSLHIFEGDLPRLEWERGQKA